MDSNYQPQTNLVSILQTLRAYAPSQQQVHENTYRSHAFQTNNRQPQIPPPASDLEEGEYDPSAYDPSLPLITTPHPQAPHAHLQYPPPTIERQHIQNLPPPPIATPHPPPSTPTSKPPSSSSSSSKTYPPPPSYRPSTITTWAPALRHVTSQTATSPDFSRRIRHLITTQHQHERAWWTGREELKKRLAGREEGRRKLDDVLGSLGVVVGGGRRSDAASSSSGKTGHDELSEEQELAMYDRKVHRACGEMVVATGKELRRLEVPFFCVMEGLVAAGKGGDDGKRKGKGTISEEELGELRGRMMALLEDLCGEED